MNIYPITDEIKAKLLPYQIQHTDNIIYSLKTYNRVLDSSDTGTGKTYSSIAACKTMNLKPLIICPKSVITSWKNVLNHFNADYYGVSNYESIQNCKMFTKTSKNDKVTCPYIKRIEVKKQDKVEEDKGKKKIGNTKLKGKKGKEFNIENDKVVPDEDIEYTYVWQNLPNDIVIIFDETHRCKNPRTLNSVILYTLAKTTTKIIMLSATVSDKPENFALVGYVLGLYNNIRNANNWMNAGGKDYDNVMSFVHDTIYPEYASRMRIRDLGKLFPDNQIVASCYDMDNAEEIQQQYKLIEEEVERLKNKEENSGCALARILYLRMKIETLKIPSYIEEAKKFLEEGNAVAIFVNFTQTLKTIADELKTNCTIHGQQTLEERNKAIDDFNSDKSHIIVCNSRSGGVGISLQDQHGNFPRVSIISPSWSAQDIIQVLGRIHRANGKTPVRQRIIFCKDTIEEQICKNMVEKIGNIAMLNDGDMLSYNIEGLTDDPDALGVDKDANLSEFDKLFLKINVLNIKKQRLEEDLKEVNNEIKEFEIILNTLLVNELNHYLY
ncbi:helicase/uvrB [Fadolivirus algeromassiliense]|jgi:superfamily II DNA or RNA helicase|uniref:Helicase/uvrB n=1 Tax=Fadolivirus FV1/VV64 TaxID=3070911 RepID=A0A7D3QWD0_9VIRU|nr:helicase/uvrB [Fadolivirus algeromassiliense]QKF94386.1 helicase/uvrB [Fadolivirus FV1/VV64]